MFVIGDVKPHEVGSVIQILQALRAQVLPFDLSPVEPEPRKILPAPAKLLPAPAGEMSAPVGEKSEGTGFADRANGRENSRPVTVNVNVLGNAVGGDGKGSTAKARRNERDGKALAAIRKKTDLIPGLVDKVDATPGRTAALVKVANREGREGARSVLTSARLRAKRVAAGQKRSVVNDTRDRKAIRSEVRRLIAGGLSHTEAYGQAAEQAQHGRAGQRKLTTKYNLPPTVATASVVRRVFESER